MSAGSRLASWSEICAHAGGRHGGVALGEHAEDELERAAGEAEFGIEGDSGEERAQESVDHLLGEADLAQAFERGGLLGREQVLQFGPERPASGT